MKTLQEIDQNLQTVAGTDLPDMIWHTAGPEIFSIYGLEPEGLLQSPPVYRRMPEETAESVSEGVYGLYRNTAGGRIRFTTDSEYVALRCSYDILCHMPHQPLTGSTGFDLYLTTDKGCTYYKSFVPPWDAEQRKNGYDAVVHFGSREKRDITIHFPLYNNVTGLLLGLQEDAAVEKSPGYRFAAPVVYYGSSITQGGCASRPGNSYQGFVSRALNLDQRNMGFSGSGKGEPEMREYLASLDMCAFVLDYDHNAPDAEHLRKTHYAVYEAVRKSHPDIPILCLSKTDVIAEELEERRQIIRETVAAAEAAGDRNIRFISGEELFGTDCREDCTVDGTHPNDLGFYRMAQGIIPVLSEMLGI